MGCDHPELKWSTLDSDPKLLAFAVTYTTADRSMCDVSKEYIYHDFGSGIIFMAMIDMDNGRLTMEDSPWEINHREGGPPYNLGCRLTQANC